MGVKDYLENVFEHKKRWYCPSCNRMVLGEKRPIDWPIVIVGTIITLGFALIFYIPYRIYLPKDRCPICKGKLIPPSSINFNEIKRKSIKNSSTRPITLFAQPSEDSPFLNKKFLKKGEIKESFFNSISFTDVGQVVLDVANGVLDSPTIKLIREKGDEEWEVKISSNNVEIYLNFFKYTGFISNAKNSCIRIDFYGDITKIRAIKDGILKIAGETIYKMNDWDKFSEVTGVTQKEVEDCWKGEIKVIQKLEQEIDIPTQIKKLAELRDSGILTDEEFEKKKKELLERL